VVCLRFLERYSRETGGEPHDVWQIRYRITESDFPADEFAQPGSYSSFYVEDAPAGDWAGELTGTADFSQPDCEPTGNDVPVFPLLDGDVSVLGPRT